MPQTVNSRKCLGLSRSAPLSSTKLRSTAPAAAIFPRRREARRDTSRAGRVSSLPGGGAGGQVGKPREVEGCRILRCEASTELAGDQVRREGAEGEKARGSLPTLRKPLRGPLGRPKGRRHFSRRPRGRGRGRVCFHFENAGAGCGSQPAARGEDLGGPTDGRPLLGFERAVTSPCVVVSVSESPLSPFIHP